MKLDELISKYLDGELSYKEDEQLRNLLKQNPEAKAEFDTAVLLHSAIREDAQKIQTPPDLLKNTEDVILLRILSASEQPLVSKDKRRYIAWIPALSFIFAIFMIATIFFVTNSNKDQQNIREIARIIENIPSSSQLTAQNQFLTTAVQNKSLIPSINNTSNNPKLNEIISDTQSKTTINDNIFSFTKNMDAFEQHQVVLMENNLNNQTSFSNDYSATIQYQSNNSELTTNRQIFTALNNSIAKSNNFNFKTTTIPNLNLSLLDNFNTPVNLSTMYSTNNFSKSNKKFTTLSQSVGYDCSENLAFGLEFGYTNYTYDRITTIKVPVSAGALNSKLEVGNNVEQTGDFIYLPVNLEQDYNQYWVSTFMDYNILSINPISLNTRVGAGFSGIGGLFYSRLLTEIELYNGIFLNIGGEVKSFKGLGHNAEKQFITTGSVIYGIQLKLY